MALPAPQEHVCLSVRSGRAPGTAAEVRRLRRRRVRPPTSVGLPRVP